MQVLGFVFPAVVQTLVLEPEVPMQAQCVRAMGRCAVEALELASLSSEQLSEATKAIKQVAVWLCVCVCVCVCVCLLAVYELYEIHPC